MSKKLIHGFIILMCILFVSSLISDVNNKEDARNEINSFEENIKNEDEVNNGMMSNIDVEINSSSNMISKVNSKIATVIVEGLNYVFSLGIKVIGSLAN